MNPTASPSRAAEERAALWAARLDGASLSARDRFELDAWLAEDATHRTLLSAYCQFSADLEQQLPLIAGIRDELAGSPTAATERRSLPWLSRPLWVGATLTAVAAAAAVVLWPTRLQNQFQNLATPVAHRQMIALVDGSQIELNARTALTVEVTSATRRVRLTDGEAFFTVAKDPQRPFYVETPAGSVRVTGTKFNVRADAPGTLEVTVQAGSVRVRPAGAALRDLRAGDRLVRQGPDLQVNRLAPAELGDALAWRRGLAVFVDMPLREALARFGRYHGRNLVATDAAATRSVGGTHRLDDLDGFLASLEEALALRVSRNLDGSIEVDVGSNRVQP